VDDETTCKTNESDLRRLLEDAYGFAAPEITLIRRGGDGNQTYKVIANETPFIARIYGEPARQHPDWALYELELLVHLAKGGISVAAPVAGRDGTWMQMLPLSGSPPAPTALFTFADGGVEWPTAPQRAHLLGASFAQLHRVAQCLPAPSDHRAFDVERLLDAPLRRMRMYLTDSDPADIAAWQTLTETATRAAALFAAIPDAGGAIGPIHGDLHQGNCHFNPAGNGNQLTFFDFSNTGIGWRVYDLSGFLWPLRDDTIRDPAIKAACDAFLDGYRNVRPLLPEEESAIIASVKARDFWETGCWLEFGRNLDPATVCSGLHSIADQFRRFPLSE
jgi:Ser/Thr protein kinase RdoA (MazF antagonist)